MLGLLKQKWKACALEISNDATDFSILQWDWDTCVQNKSATFPASDFYFISCSQTSYYPISGTEAEVDACNLSEGGCFNPFSKLGKGHILGMDQLTLP